MKYQYEIEVTGLKGFQVIYTELLESGECNSLEHEWEFVRERLRPEEDDELWTITFYAGEVYIKEESMLHSALY